MQACVIFSRFLGFHETFFKMCGGCEALPPIQAHRIHSPLLLRLNDYARFFVARGGLLRGLTGSALDHRSLPHLGV